MSDTWRSVVEESDTDPETVSDNLFTRSIKVIRNNLFGHHFEDSGDVSSDNQSFGVSDVASSVDSQLISGLLDLSVSVAEGVRSNDNTDLYDMVEGKAWVFYPAYEEKNGFMKNYVRKLELIMECDGVKSASTKMNILKSKLSDETLDELNQLVAGEQVSTYDSLKEWLCNRFSDDLSVNNAMIKLRGFHIRVEESYLSKDLSEVAELVMKSSTSKSQSDIVNRTKERFMDKIDDDELFKRLLSKDYSSVSEMINDLCTVFMLNNKRKNDNQKRLKDKRIASNDPNNRPAKFNGICHSCGTRGHKAAECRKRRPDNNKSSDKPQQSKINSNIEIIKHNTLSLIKCHVKSSRAIALVDTGANIGLIRQSLALRQDVPIKTSNVKIRQTFGSKVETLGYVDASITINNVTKQVRLEVISDRNTDKGYDILLDTKAIKDFQLIIDLANNSMKAGNTDLDMCYVENESDSVNTLQFNHSVISKELALERIFEENPDAKNAIAGDGNVVSCSQFEAPVQHFTTDVPHRFIKYTVPFNLKHIVDNEIDKLIEMGIIIPMETPYLHNLILVRKSNDEYRRCLDMRPTNAVTVVDSYPVGNMHEILSDLYGNTLFSSLDIRQAYYQISIPKVNQVRFGLYTDRGTYVYTRLPFGYVNSGQIFQRYLDRVLGSNHLRYFARAYYDDIIIKTRSGLDDHLTKVGEVMEALSRKKLSLNIQKCQIAHDSLEFLGQLITPQGIQPAYENKQMIKNLRVEKSITGIKKFLGCEILLSDECVIHPQFDKPFFVYVDSSELYHGAVICQEDSSGKLKVVRYWSKKRTHSKKLRSSVYIELQSIVEVVRKFRNYFIGSDVTIFTDNRGLISVIRESTDIHFSQWIYELMNYRLTIKYVPGPKNQLADTLSRTVTSRKRKNLLFLKLRKKNPLISMIQRTHTASI